LAQQTLSNVTAEGKIPGTCKYPALKGTFIGYNSAICVTIAKPPYLPGSVETTEESKHSCFSSLSPALPRDGGWGCK